MVRVKVAETCFHTNLRKLWSSLQTPGHLLLSDTFRNLECFHTNLRNLAFNKTSIELTDGERSYSQTRASSSNILFNEFSVSEWDCDMCGGKTINHLSAQAD